MILYTLRCSKDHHFEQWFDNSGDYDAKKQDGALVCPECGDTHVGKAIMAPNVAKTAAAAAAPMAACPSNPMGGGCGGCAFAGQH